MAERTQRYTAGEKQQIAANRRTAAGAAKYGQASYADLGYRPEKDAGQAFLRRQEEKAKHGAFAPTSWQTQYDSSGRLIGVKPMGAQTGRIEELRRQGIDPTQWIDPAKVLKPGQLAAIERTTVGAKGQARQAFFNQNPELAARPGGGMDAWVHQRYLNTLPTDPTTGWKVNQAGELYDPTNVLLTGQRREAPFGGMAPPSGQQAPPNFYGGGYGGGMPPGFGGYGQPGGYIPGYAAPFSMPGYGMPGYGGNLGALGGGNMAPRINPVNYRTVQQGGGSSFGTYQPSWG